MFITIEGIEGVGKSTAITTLTALLEAQGRTLCVTREPGGTPLGEDIRSLLLKNHEEPMTPTTELLLMFAARAQHIHSVILPAIKAGKCVLSDRFTDASYAYQGGGRSMNKETIAFLEKAMAPQFNNPPLKPDFTLLLDAPESEALSRAKNRGEPDRIEQEALTFFKKVRHTYLERAKEEPHRFYVVDATLSLKEVKQQLITFVNTLNTYP